MSLNKKLAVGAVALGSLLYTERAQGLIIIDENYGSSLCAGFYEPYFPELLTAADFRDYFTLDSFVNDAIPILITMGLSFMVGHYFGKKERRRERERDNIDSFLINH